MVRAPRPKLAWSDDRASSPPCVPQEREPDARLCILDTETGCVFAGRSWGSVARWAQIGDEQGFRWFMTQQGAQQALNSEVPPAMRGSCRVVRVDQLGRQE